MPTSELDPFTQKNVNEWLNGDYDSITKNEIRKLLESNPKSIEDAFFTKLSFGTAGLRGLMGVGSNRINIYTIRATTQGLAHYICKQPKSTDKYYVLIGYDSRYHSRQFAEETAKVLAGNGIHVYIYTDIRPTPLISYGCRLKRCSAAVMITASHNPPEYNGYKVYGPDGAQIPPPRDMDLMREINKITNPSQIKITSFNSSLIQEISTEIDDAYVNDIRTLQNCPNDNRNYAHALKIVYSSLHGTGITMVPKVLADWGFEQILFVEDQVIPDGSFPTTPYPNPEEKVAMQLGLDLLFRSESDLFIATDPDADRMGVAVRHGGKTFLLTGHQTICLCLKHICEVLTRQNRLPNNAAFIKTIGTTELFQAICDHYQRPCFNVLTGFKYIGQKIAQWETHSSPYQFIFGGEESLGYLIGTFARDKDAVVCSALICEVALQAKIQGKTLIDKLYEIYCIYGIYEERSLNVIFDDTKEGKKQMTETMNRLRQIELKEIATMPLQSIEDYQRSLKIDLKTGHRKSLELPISNVLLYRLVDGSKVMIRPSGTEPKIKLSCGVHEKTFETIDAGIAAAQKKCDKLLEALRNLCEQRE